MASATCKVIRSGDAYVGHQGFTYLAGLTGATAGSRAISMTVVTLPDGARARTHLHRAIETAVYVIDGEAEMYFGDALQELLVARAGEYVYIPADVPHLVLNRSGAPCRALVAHTAADDQAGIVLLPELDALVWHSTPTRTGTSGPRPSEDIVTGQGSAGNVLAALCSFFVPGLGQLLQGRLIKAVVQFVLAIALWFVLLGWAIHLWSVLDAATWKPKV